MRTNFLKKWAALLLALSLSACSSLNIFGNSRPAVPDGSHRVAINTNTTIITANATQTAAKNNVSTAAQTEQSVQGGKTDSTEKSRSAVVLEGPHSGSSVIRVSLMDTLLRIADNTGLRFVRNDLEDEIVLISPTEDPFNALRQLAQHSRYRINFDRENGRLWASQESKQSGLFVLRDDKPVIQMGSPMAKRTYPKEPIALTEALRLLAPDDFEVGYADELDLNIHVDLSQARSWEDGLEGVALQTPYRIVFDWDKKLIYAIPTQRRITVPKGVSS